MSIVAFTGAIGSGKSTAANYLTANYKFKELAFATPLKEIAIQMGFNWDQVYGSQEQKLAKHAGYNISGRRFMQAFGTDICRNLIPKYIPDMELNGETIWCRILELQIKKMQQADPNCRIVISDARFVDELKMLERLNAIIIRLETVLPMDEIEHMEQPSQVEHMEQPSQVEQVEQNNYKAHVSEMQTIQSKGLETHTIYNNETIEVLYQTLDHMIKNKMIVITRVLRVDHCRNITILSIISIIAIIMAVMFAK